MAQLRSAFTLKRGLVVGVVALGVFMVMRFFDDVKGREFDFLLKTSPEQHQELLDVKEQINHKEWIVVTFASRPQFKKVGDSIDVLAYDVFTREGTNEVHAGEYVVNTTLRRGSSGPAFAPELFLATDEPKLVKKLTPPEAPPGATAILPGQVVLRKLSREDLAKLDDKYAISLPANTFAELWLTPSHSEYEFDVSLFVDGKPVPRVTEEDYNSSYYKYKTLKSGVYELRIRGPGKNPVDPTATPDRYNFYVSWGHARHTWLPDSYNVNWRKSP